ncbi:DUF3343 domain-containing protein [Leptotrichia sp. OH3620_COT-345]|uniref:DUF3343 domain-containing protein n=1 Tax=Leptotrichia sp. OH3620_COT-345 TaxID=2491048 RepID=UPI000F645E81|nr:DUF3343 domain-containing protein [Leptotrichia sp. OH3620_COT-345]RRD39605.1 DUF3343 domain-containing protein [Leptotrichia sp. OH3620_COT-345]
MIKEGLVVFYDTHDSIKADNICLSQNVDADLVPVHPDISLGCGFMLKTGWNNFSNLIKMLENQNIRYRALYYSKKTGMKREIELLYEDEK